MADEIKRRDFLKLVGLGSATAVVANCADPVERVIPYLVKEEEITPGKSTWFATVCRECPAGCGIIMRTREGRALKAEGNPDHPVNAGKLCMRGQSSVQNLYNPDRLRGPARPSNGSYTPLAWDEATQEFAERLAAAKQSGKANNVAYVGALTPGTFDQLVGDFMNAVGSDASYVYEPLAYEPIRKAASEVFGVDALPKFDLSQAETIVSFGAQYLETWLSPVEYAAQFAQHKTYENGKVGVSYFVGPRQSLTAANSDKWVAVKAGHELTVALGVLNVILGDNLAKQDIGAAGSIARDYTAAKAAEQAGIDEETIRRMARRLAQGTSIALPGSTVANPEALAKVVFLINAALGNLGSTVQFGPNQNQGRATADLSGLIARMELGEIDVLVLNDVNPAFSLPDAARWNEAIKNVSYVVALASHPTETAQQASLVLATHTPYEQWNDYVPREGVHGLLQPVMRPLYDTRHPGDVLLAAARSVSEGAGGVGNYEDYLKQAWQGLAGGGNFEQFWRESLQRGGYFAEAAGSTVSVGGNVATDLPPAPSIEGLALVAYPTIQWYDGRMANTPWLQEQPDPMTKLSWQSWVEVSPKTADRLGVQNGDVVSVETEMGKVEAPVYVYRGIRDDVIAIPIGQGHDHSFGRYAGEANSWRGEIIPVEGKRGVNPLAILPATAMLGAAKVGKTGRTEQLISSQGSDVQDGRPILQTIPASQVPQFVEKTVSHTAELLKHDKTYWEAGTIPHRVAGQLGEHPGQNFYSEIPHPEYRWGMTINLQNCIGCGACQIACQSENNVPVVGPELIAKGREMSWLWIDRYYDEDSQDPKAYFIPSLCQQCTSAPCETVCPVYATYHNPEGLNAQVYNRCVGTRYCGNNCPYKVRRFNWFDYAWPDPLNLQLNPDVAVRAKGVMEKCTFCVQRTREAKDLARDEGRMVQDGDVTTACAQTCPTDAIVFGNLKDPNSQVAKLTGNWRAEGGETLPMPVENALGYQVLVELNTQTAVTYLRRIVQDEEI